jgi:carbamoyltransferase
MVRRDVICGLKLTHDGAVAVLDSGELLFSVEAEKIDNRPRYSRLSDMADVVAQLDAHGIDIGDLDAISVDGWVQSRGGDAAAEITLVDRGTQTIGLAGYAVIGEPGERPDALERFAGSDLPLGSKTFEYSSYPHATGHALASYCTSPFALRGEPALVLVWDGGMPAVLYLFDPAAGKLTSLGTVVPIAGALYPIFASQFDPFKVPAAQRRALGAVGDFAQLEALLPISGKVMAYAALDAPSEQAIGIMQRITSSMGPIGVTGALLWSHRVRAELEPLELSTAATLASFQEHLFRLLTRGLAAEPAAGLAAQGLPLCLSGGCALNIKWNAGLRASGRFRDLWVPPFPNDAGSAIGTACTEMLRRTGRSALQWSVYSGPGIRPTAEIPPGWTATPCEIERVAESLHRDGEPVVVLHDRAELGPRALGHRSIIAPATSPGMQDRLNRIKGREAYRPVAPICLEDRAPELFDPGSPDPFMLFEHRVRPAWLERVPAIVHADGSARLQTVGPGNPLVHRLLSAYDRLSGVPVLCNTSANHPGRGFFPDAGSAMRWGGVRLVWCDGVLYSREA